MQKLFQVDMKCTDFLELKTSQHYKYSIDCHYKLHVQNCIVHTYQPTFQLLQETSSLGI